LHSDSSFSSFETMPSKNFKTILICLFIFNSTINCSAQKSDIGNWFIYFGNQALTKKLNWHNEIQYRNYNFAGDLQQLMLRTGIGYNLSENNNNLLIGYGYIHSEQYIKNSESKTDSKERRIFQQFITRQNFGRFYLQHRYRLEERFMKDDILYRFRYFLALNIPLNNKTMVNNTVYFSAYDEIFVNGQSPVYDRNRLYGGLGFYINKNFKFELGYMSQMLESTQRSQFQIILFNNLSFSK
jgi:hypothetical protein